MSDTKIQSLSANAEAFFYRRIAARNPQVLFWQVPYADHCGALSTTPREFERKLLQWFVAATENRALGTEN